MQTRRNSYLVCCSIHRKLLTILTLWVCISPRLLTAASDLTGPYRWKSVAIHGGGFVAGIIPHPAVRGLIYARTDVGGAYRWDAATSSWVPLTDWVTSDDGTLMGCESIAVDPNQPNRLFIALGMYTNSWSGNGAIVRSNDRGKTFERTNVPFKMGGNDPGRSAGERLVVDPNDGQILFFGSRADGLWKSADRAKTWTRVDSFPAVATSASALDSPGSEWANGISFVKFDRSSGKRGSRTRVLYAGVCTQETSFFRSADGGATWTAVPGQPTGLRPNHMVISPQGMIRISYADQAGPNGMSDGALWQYDSSSGQWTDITPVKPSDNDKFGYGAVTMDAQHPDTLMACSMDRWGQGDKVFRTIDSGKTWTSQTVGGNYDRSLIQAPDAHWALSLAPHWLGDIEIDPFDSNHAMFVTGFGIWATHEATVLDSGKGVHWTFDDRGLEETVPLELASPPSGPHLISVIGDFDGFVHDNLDVSPERGRHTPNIGSTGGLDFAGKIPNRVVRCGNGRGLYSDDGGRTWTPFLNSPDGAADGISISSDGQTIVWGSNRSTDLGKTWTLCQGLSSGGKFIGAQPISDRINPNRFYTFDNQSGKLLVSSDAAASFIPAAAGLPGNLNQMRSVPGKAGDLWLVTGDHLFHSIDAGQSFLKLSNTDRDQKIGFGKAAPGSDYPAIFMVGAVNGNQGMYRSDDAGQSWSRIDDDQHHFGALNVIIGDPRIYGRVYVGTTGRGIVYGDLAWRN